MSRVLRCSGYDLVVTDIVRAQGCTLYDAQGRRTLDLEAGVWCAALGHNHPRVNDAIRQQLDRVAHLVYRYSAEVVEQAAQAVLETLPFPEGQCLFLSLSTIPESRLQLRGACAHKRNGFVCQSNRLPYP